MPRLLRDATDAQLLGLVRDGSTEAFGAIVDRYRPQITRYCATLTRAERLDDAVQQTFLSAWLALGRGTEVRELRPWLYSVARNAAIDQLRLARRELVELSTDLAGGIDPAAVAAARDEVGDVLRAVSELPERQRTALLETAVHGRAAELVAVEMGLSGGALRQLVHRARTSVRGMVASFVPGPLATWFAQAGGEEGTRRIAVLISGAGQGATAAALAATATVASVGAIGTAGIASLGGVAGEPSQTSSGAQTRAQVGDGGRAGTEAAPGAAVVQLATLVRIPLSGELAPPTQEAEGAGGDVDESGASPRSRSADGPEPGADERDRERAGGDRDDRWMDDTGATDGARGGDPRPAKSDSDWSPRALASSGDGHERRRGGGRGGGWDRDREDDGWRDEQGDASAPDETADPPVVAITPQDPPPSPAAETAPPPSEPDVNQPAPAETSTGGGDAAAINADASDADAA